MPAPLGPMRPVTRPASTSRSTPRSACTPPNRTSASATCRSGIVSPPLRSGLLRGSHPRGTSVFFLVRPGFFRREVERLPLGSLTVPISGRPPEALASTHGTLHGRAPGRPGGTQERGPARGQPEGRRAPPRQGQADRPRAHRVPARRGVLPGARHAGPAPGPRHGPGGQPALHRRRGHRLRHHRRPAGLHLQPGLHRLRRGAGRGLRREDPQGDGPGRLHRGPDDRPQRRRRGPDPGGRRLAALLRRDLPPQRDVLGRHPPDQRDPRPLRRRRRLLAGHDRLHLHGAGHVAHVHHRSRRGEDGHGRGRHARGAGRRHEPRHQVGRRHLRGARREGLPRRGAPPPLVPALQQPRGAADRALRRRARPGGDGADRLPPDVARTSPTT